MIIILTALVALWAWPGLRDGSGRDDRKDLSVWHGAFSHEPGPLDPARAVTVTDGAACALVYSGLLRPDEEGRPVPDLAESWSVTADGLTYTFSLRSGVRFHDGTELTADDLVFSFSRILDPAVGSSRAWVLDAIKGAKEFLRGEAAHVAGLEAVDSLTVRITLSAPLAHFPSLLCMPAAYVVSPEAAIRYGKDFGYHPVGTGPWILESWREGVEMSFVANADYYEQRARLDRLVIRFIPDAATRQAEFEAGNFEVLALGEENAAHFTSHPVYAAHILTAPELAVVYVALNCRKPPFDSVLVRRALNHAIDRKAILDAIRPGRYTLANGSVPVGLAGHLPTWRGYEYDPSLARSLLARAGYPDGLDMDLYIRTGGLSVFLAEPIQAELARVGVRVRIIQLEAQAFAAATGDEGDADACLTSWVADYADPENFLYPLFHSSNLPSEGNAAWFADPVCDRLLEAIHREADRERRAVLCQAAERAVFAQAPWIPMFFPVEAVVCQPHVRGYRLWPVYNGNKMTDVWLSDEPGARREPDSGRPGGGGGG
jgi:peptide/nickel transport system substrate-binding protein/oligopeptide transport system substrate-binding protein